MDSAPPLCYLQSSISEDEGEKMKLRYFLAVAAALIAVAALASPALAGWKPSLYGNATWYSKYEAVAAGALLTCAGDPGTLTFGTNVDASHECGSQSETSIAINPAQTSNVIAGSNEIQRLPMRAMASLDGGKTFTGADVPLPPSRTNNGFDFGSDPAIAFDSAGHAYYSWIVVDFSAGGSINGTSMAVSRSLDGGRTWVSTFFAPQTGEGQFNDKPYITVDNNKRSAHFGRIYVAWDNATGNSSSTKNGNNVVVSHSDDDGLTFSAPVAVSGNFTGATGGIGADPFVTSNGTLHVAWTDYAHGAILQATSTDGGATFSAPTVITLTQSAFDLGIPAQASRRALIYPSCSSYGATLYCSWSDGTDLASDVFASRSTDGGSTWSTPTALGTPGADQFNQWLAVDPSNGSVNVAYYDTGGDSTARSTVYTLSRSTDGGKTFTQSPVANARTDENSPDANLGNQYGDYEGIAAYGGIVRPVWTDRRAAVAALGLREEVFTAAVSSR
jgi:hypothetical protein